MPGAFVVFEGGEGAGKSTQCRLLADALTMRGFDVVVTREPGGTPIGEAIREVLLGAGSAGMAARTEALLFAAARAEHAAALIRPSVARGDVVISDRYLDSSVAYQGAGRGLGEETIAELSLWATEELVPDLTVVLDVDPAVGVQRAHDANRMEAEPAPFHDAVRGSFLRRAEAAPERYLVLAADQPREVVAERVLEAVLALLSDGPAATSAPVAAVLPAAPFPTDARDPAATSARVTAGPPTAPSPTGGPGPALTAGVSPPVGTRPDAGAVRHSPGGVGRGGRS